MPGFYTVTILALVQDLLLQSLDMVFPSPPDVAVTEFCFCAPPSISGLLMKLPVHPGDWFTRCLRRWTISDQNPCCHWDIDSELLATPSGQRTLDVCEDFFSSLGR